MKKLVLIPAVAYLRKSTAGTKADGKERQEHSIPQQKQEIEKLAKKHGYVIIRWYADPGKSGWKRGAARPDFSRMLDDARTKGDFVAILCDDVDRFSRGAMDEVQADAYALKQVGIQFIVTVAQGVYDLGEQAHDIGKALKFIVDVWGSNQFSRKLSRRIALRKADDASKFKRSAVAPYGMKSDGKGGLTPGKRKHIAIVQRVFHEFVTLKRSLNSIAAGLNRDGILTPREKAKAKWYVVSIKELLSRPCYKGEFCYGRRQQGQFHTTTADGEVVENKNGRQWSYREPIYRKANAYKAIVPPKVWDAAQRRLASNDFKKSRRPRNGNPLSGVLVCDKCGKLMYGCELKERGYRVYRCSTPAKTGMGTCGTFEIREEQILPLVLQMLAQEMADINTLMTSPPEHLSKPGARRQDEASQVLAERDELTQRIDRAENNLMVCDDSDTVMAISKKIRAMRDELAKLDEEVAKNSSDPGFPSEDFAALLDWYFDFAKRAIRVSAPVGADKEIVAVSSGLVTSLDEAFPYDDKNSLLLLDPRVVNEALHSLNTKVRLRWRSHKKTLRNGKEINCHELAGGTFSIGGHSRKLTVNDGTILCKARSAARCSGTRGEGRCETRRGTG